MTTEQVWEFLKLYRDEIVEVAAMEDKADRDEMHETIQAYSRVMNDLRERGAERPHTPEAIYDIMDEIEAKASEQIHDAGERAYEAMMEHREVYRD